MPLAPNTKFDHYEILAPLGKGGMGEVYRAKDTRLNREVAIKVLPSEIAHDAERLRRFEQEARAVGALNHPNILTVYDFGNYEGNPYLVMELLDGEELRAQLPSNTEAGALPVRKAIDYAQQIAAGLAAAHEKGIVHRDLKPENLFVTTDGRVKILDFGLAKLRGSRKSERGAMNEEEETLLQDGSAVHRSSFRDQPLTLPGTVMGTVAYMSPEQVRGQDLEQRSDIFSFGLILYEMLAGQRAFQKASVPETMAAIANEEPRDLSELNPKVTPPLEKIVRHCLEKKPERRFQSARDLGFALEALTMPSSSGGHRTEVVLSPNTTAVAPRRDRSGWLVAAVLLLTTLGLAWAYFTRRTAPETPLLTLSLLPPEKSSFGHIAVSPDGQWLAFTAATGSKVQLWVRALASNNAKSFDGTDGATYPFWSPDSRFIGFFAGGKLKKIPVGGGLPTTVCDAGVATGGTWNREDVIVFSALGGRGISRVSASGGAPTVFYRTAMKQTDLHDPSFLPDGRHFLYLVMNTGDKDSRGVHVGSLDGNVRQRLLGDVSNAVYAASTTGQGYLLFSRDGALLAQPFNVATRQLSGEAVVVAARVGTVLGTTTSYRRNNFSVSDNGLLVFDPQHQRQRNQLFVVDRSGKPLHSLEQLDNTSVLRFAPDEKRFSFSRLNTESFNNDVWVSDLTGSNVARFTFDPGNDQFGIWSPDGNRIAWASNRASVFDLYEKDANLKGEDKLLFQNEYFKFPTDWSRDGRYIVYRQIHPQTNYDLMILPLFGERKPFAFLQSAANEAAATFSPDGRWLAYQSDESGRYEVYVESFPARGGKRQISTSGGIGPSWRGDGKELYFYAPDGKLIATPITNETSLEMGTPTALFEFRPSGNVIVPHYSASRDGQRFLLSTIVETQPNAPLTVVQNWTAEIKR